MTNGNNYLVDTNILIAFFKSDLQVIERFRKLNNINIPCISIGELYFGFYKSEKVEENIDMLSNALFQYNICDITLKTTAFYGKIKLQLKKLGNPIPQNDIWIAAIAQENDLIIATRDKHFLDLGFIKTEYW
jgi:tRNA(fMet)-specific endonuclease VapC